MLSGGPAVDAALVVANLKAITTDWARGPLVPARTGALFTDEYTPKRVRVPRRLRSKGWEGVICFQRGCRMLASFKP